MKTLLKLSHGIIIISKGISRRIEYADGIITPQNSMLSLIGTNNVTNTIIESVSCINKSGWNVSKMEIVGQMFVVIDLRIPISFISHDNLVKVHEFFFSGIPLTNIR